MKPDEIKNNDLIIIDASKLDSKLSQENLRIIEKISSDCHIQICAISHHKNDDLNYLNSSWVDCFFKGPLLLEQLDNYFRIRFKYSPHSFPDRRRQERRFLQRRNEAGVYRFVDSVMPMPPYCIDDSNSTLTPSTVTSYNVGPFKIDTNCNAVSYKGKDLCLTDKEFKLFSLLATNVDRVFSTDEIIEHLWPATYRANKSDLYQYMHLLRKKIEKDPDHPHWILTIKRVGYRLNLPAVLIS
ncbi:MAG: winged helix-turn-helix domain-containing protein [Methylococcaceae bacterium]|nr:winged helix-turn-helix domain-containing protein [Methylococcaceae bacterium]